jgi:hypothetical protein
MRNFTEIHTKLKFLCLSKSVSLKEYAVKALSEKYERDTGEPLMGM